MRNMDGNDDLTPILREVVEASTFTEQVSKIMADVRRFDEIMDGIVWALARAPERFPIVHEGSNVRIAKTDPWGSISLRVFFTFDDKQTHLLWVEPVPD